MIKNAKIQEIKDFNNDLIAKMLKACPDFNLKVNYRTQFIIIKDNSIRESAYYRTEIDAYEAGMIEIDEDALDGISISHNKIEFFRNDRRNGLSIELIEDNETRIKIRFDLQDRNIFDEDYYAYDCFGSRAFIFRNDLNRFNDSFTTKIKLKNFLTKNFDLFKDFIKSSNEYLNLINESL
ncbi:hypothetical phage protein [Campylobacter phage CP220]|uniref:Hypothetical phage protein n=1 Tax=Campylobacter phage CP220 TaxID=2994044 RepID=D5GVD1_9CAUD|nr:hypothetical protein APL47_gp181 [Campylobacter phage CP220]CBJ93948.1 hypothetical phage protein [Campylobacter phage CP220]